MKEQERQQPYAYWLYGITGMGSRTIESLLTQAGTPEQLYRMKEKELQVLFHSLQISNAKLQALLQQRDVWDVESKYESLQEQGIRFIPLGHAAYPKRLLHIPDRPYALFVKGTLPLEEKVSVAVIGARTCSEYGRFLAGEFGGRLAAAGIQVISGLARGIDGISQRTALERGGKSFGVLGCGVDICYPKENRKLYEVLCKKGGLISTYLPGTPPCAQHFPPRNRIISGLSDAVLVVEAKEKSGTLITVDMALEQGRDVFVVPGRVTDCLSHGCNQLLAQGAGIALSPEHLLMQLRSGLYGNSRLQEQKPEKDMQKDDIQEEKKMILHVLDYYPQSLEQIREQMQGQNPKQIGGNHHLSLQQIMHLLMTLCMEGKVKQMHGNYFVKQGSDSIS